MPNVSEHGLLFSACHLAYTVKCCFLLYAVVAVYSHQFPFSIVTICLPFAPRSLLASSLLWLTPTSSSPFQKNLMVVHLRFQYYRFTSRGIRISQVPVYISTNSLAA